MSLFVVDIFKRQSDVKPASCMKCLCPECLCVHVCCRASLTHRYSQSRTWTPCVWCQSQASFLSRMKRPRSSATTYLWVSCAPCVSPCLDIDYRVCVCVYFSIYPVSVTGHSPQVYFSICSVSVTGLSPQESFSICSVSVIGHSPPKCNAVFIPFQSVGTAPKCISLSPEVYFSSYPVSVTGHSPQVVRLPGHADRRAGGERTPVRSVTVWH